MCLVISTALMFALLVTKSFGAAALITLVVSATREDVTFLRNTKRIYLSFVIPGAPLVPMLDARTIDLLCTKSRYGEIRLYGALSFGLLIMLTGGLLNTGESNTANLIDANGFKTSFYLHICLSLISGLLVLFFPIFSDSAVKTTSSLDYSSENEILKMTNHSDQLDRDVCLSEDMEDTPGIVSVDMSPAGSSSSLSTSSRNDNNLNTKSRQSVYAVLSIMLRLHPEVVSFAAIVFLSGVGDGVIDSFLFLR